MSSASLPLTRALRRIDHLAAQRLPAQQLVESVADELQAAMAVEGLFMAATDPDTMLGLGAGVVHGMPETLCHPFWEYEFEVPDFNKFTELARARRATSPTCTPRRAGAPSAARAGASCTR